MDSDRTGNGAPQQREPGNHRIPSDIRSGKKAASRTIAHMHGLTPYPLLSIPIIAMTLYAVGYVASIIGDRLYKGSGEQFDTGPHYIVTYPMLLAGFFLAPASILVTTAGGIITRIKKRRDQGAGGYGSPAAGSKKR